MCCYLLHLQAEVEVPEENRKTDKMLVLEPGDIYGEICLVSSMPRRVTVRAKTPVDTLMLTKDSLDKALQLYPEARKIIEERSQKRFGGIVKDYQIHMKQRKEITKRRGSLFAKEN